MLKLITDWFTEDNGTSWCIGRAIGFAASVAALYKFVVIPTPDFLAFGGCIAAIVASIAAKNYSERK